MWPPIIDPQELAAGIQAIMLLTILLFSGWDPIFTEDCSLYANTNSLLPSPQSNTYGTRRRNLNFLLSK